MDDAQPLDFDLELASARLGKTDQGRVEIRTRSLRLPPMVVQTMPLRAQLGLICSRSPATPPTGCSCGWVTNTEEGD